MYLGDAWCFIGIERHSKLVLCFELGKRTETSAGRFMEKLAAATHPAKRFQLTTDGLPAYPYAVGKHLGDRVDYAQLIKAMPRRRKANAATARPKSSARNPNPSRETQTCNGSARLISSGKMGACGSGASALRG
jgi:hypothetical protein